MWAEVIASDHFSTSNSLHCNGTVAPSFKPFLLNFCPWNWPLDIVKVLRGKNCMPWTPHCQAWDTLVEHNPWLIYLIECIVKTVVCLVSSISVRNSYHFENSCAVFWVVFCLCVYFQTGLISWISYLSLYGLSSLFPFFLTCPVMTFVWDFPVTA